MLTIPIAATLATGFFAGGACFISLVEHPARLQCGVEFAIQEFRPSFGRAHRMMAGLAFVAFALGLTAWLQGAGLIWLVGGLLMVANGPWTAVLIRPLNVQLLDPGLNISSTRAADLIARWGRYHLVRSALGCTGFVLFVVGLAAG